MPLTFLRADITTLSCDAIVNAANTKLLPGGGVCGAIFKAAGFLPLALACRKIGSCAVGDAVMTKGFKLKAKAIIHTVGPVYGKDPANQERLLGDCYRNSLRLAAENGFESIAFPLISSGIYGYPKDEALRIATNAIKDFLQASETDMQVFLEMSMTKPRLKSAGLCMRTSAAILTNGRCARRLQAVCRRMCRSICRLAHRLRTIFREAPASTIIPPKRIRRMTKYRIRRRNRCRARNRFPTGRRISRPKQCANKHRCLFLMPSETVRLPICLTGNPRPFPKCCCG